MRQSLIHSYKPKCIALLRSFYCAFAIIMDPTDEKSPWWEASEKDNFDINAKLLRVGCRPLTRTLADCRQKSKQDGSDCSKLADDLELCTHLLEGVKRKYV